MDMKDAIELVRDHEHASMRTTDAVRSGRGEKGAYRELEKINKKLLRALTGEEPTNGQIAEAMVS